MRASSDRSLGAFLAEAGEQLEELSRELLRLDEAGTRADPELVNGVFRRAHSLKGLAATYGRTEVAGLAHALEDLLDELRLGRLAAEAPVVDVLLEGAEVLGRMLAELGDGGDPAAPGGSVEAASGLTVRIQVLAARRRSAPGDDLLDRLGLGPVRAVLTEYEEHRLRENVRRGLAVHRVRAAFDLADFDRGLVELTGALKPLGEVVSTLPSAEPCEGIAFDLLVASSLDAAALAEAVRPLGATVERLGAGDGAAFPPPRDVPRPAPPPERAPVPEEPVAPPPGLPPIPFGSPPEGADDAGDALAPAAPAEVEPPEAPLARAAAQTVRVDIRKLDRLMGVVGELGLLRSNLQRLADRVKAAGLEPRLGAELQREGRALERRLSELRDGLLEVRMVPLGQVFDRLARVVRRIAREAGKELELRVEGPEVELDKGIVETLSDPLLHLIRNSIDHGIERPEVRASRGKPRRGLLVIAASQRGSHAVVEVSDDGAGLDEERIREVAIDRGLGREDDIAALSRREVQNLIFEPGFSTSRVVTELSGRGVGLDVVRTNVARLSGRIEVASEPGLGTSFLITLPVTLAILPGLLVAAEGRSFAVPLASVLEIVPVRREEIRTLARREVLDVRGTTLPLVRLGRLFRFEPEVAAPARGFVVVVGLAQERLGLVVDAVLGQEDLVVKGLGGALGPVPGVAGATDLGERGTVLVLDVGAILAEVLDGSRLPGVA